MFLATPRTKPGFLFGISVTNRPPLVAKTTLEVSEDFGGFLTMNLSHISIIIAGMEEIEVKYLDINLKEIQNKLIEIGAKKISEFILRQKVYDYPDLRLNKTGAWVRLREEGGKVTLAYKRRLGIKDGIQNDDGMEEIETEVGSFEKNSYHL